MPKPFARPFVRQVFPAPRGPLRATTPPFDKSGARLIPRLKVSFADEHLI